MEDIFIGAHGQFKVEKNGIQNYDFIHKHRNMQMDMSPGVTESLTKQTNVVNNL